jgi:ABC-2 type transport system ATP-binding protein
MHTVEVSHVAKSFGQTRAVTDVTFAVQRGEIFGLLGPNGAGKTTTIRLMLDIFKPERGAVRILGGPMTEDKKDRIGYMPEERGLYQDAPLERCLIYLAKLKGLPASEARKQLRLYLDLFDLTAHKTKKVKELSKGMQQKAQIISTILHRPELVIIDEPFTALDPINTQIVKDVIRQLRNDGATILMSTHQMHQVEELCDRIVLIDRGRNLLYGDLHEIRRRYAGDALLVQTSSSLPAVRGVSQVIPHNGDLKLMLDSNITPQEVLKALVAQDIPLDKFEVALPTLDEIFIQVVAEGEAHE